MNISLRLIISVPLWSLGWSLYLFMLLIFHPCPYNQTGCSQTERRELKSAWLRADFEVAGNGFWEVGGFFMMEGIMRESIHEGRWALNFHLDFIHERENREADGAGRTLFHRLILNLRISKRFMLRCLCLLVFF